MKNTSFTSTSLRVAVSGVSALGTPFIAQAAAIVKIVGIVCKIANYLFTIALVIGVIYALVAAFKYMTAGGDSAKVSEAHKTLTWAAVGIAVAIFAGSLPGVIASLMGYTDTLPNC
jgi:hypothetical protein